jgi:hypothetical protein
VKHYVMASVGGDKRYGRRQGFESGWLYHGFLSILLGGGETRCYGCFFLIPYKTQAGDKFECNFCFLGSKKGGGGGDEGF